MFDDGEDQTNTTKYLVELWNLRASDLPAMNKEGTADVYVRANFDHYKIVRTNTVKNSLSPTWKCCFDFSYETRFPKKLYVKSLMLGLPSKASLSLSPLCSMCLLTLLFSVTCAW